MRRSDTHDDTASDTAGEGPRLTGVIRASRSEVRVTFSPREAGQAKGWRSGGKSRGAGSCCESWDAERPERVPPQTARLRSIHATISAWGNDKWERRSRTGRCSTVGEYSGIAIQRAIRTAIQPGGLSAARAGADWASHRNVPRRGVAVARPIGRDSAEGSTPVPRVAPQLAGRLAVWGPSTRAPPTMAHTWLPPDTPAGWKWGTGVGVRHSSNAVLSNAPSWRAQSGVISFGPTAA